MFTSLRHNLSGQAAIEPLSAQAVDPASPAQDAPAQGQLAPVIQHARQLISESGNKARLIRSYLELRPNAEDDDKAMPQALRAMTAAILDGDPVNAEAFAEIVREINESDERAVSEQLAEMRNKIYSNFSKKQAEALHPGGKSTTPINVRLTKHNAAVDEMSGEIQAQQTSSSVIRSQARWAMHLAEMLRERVDLSGSAEAISAMDERQGTLKREYFRIVLTEVLASGLLSLSQGREALKAIDQEYKAAKNFESAKWDLLNPQQKARIGASIDNLVDDGSKKLYQAIHDFNVILTWAQMLDMDTCFFNPPLSVSSYSKLVTKPIKTTRDLIGVAAVTYADAVNTLIMIHEKGYESNFCLHGPKALQSKFDIEANSPCQVSAEEMTARRDAMSMLQKPSTTMYNVLKASIDRIEEYSPLLKQQVLEAEEKQVHISMHAFTCSLQDVANNQMFLHLHKMTEAIWYGVQKLGEGQANYPGVAELIRCKELAVDMRDFCSTLYLLRTEGTSLAPEDVRRVPAELRSAVIHNLSGAFSDLPARLSAMRENIQTVKSTELSPDMLAFTRQEVLNSLEALQKLVYLARTGLQREIDMLPQDQQLASSQSDAQRHKARDFIKGHFLSDYARLQSEYAEEEQRARLAQELIDECANETSTRGMPLKGKKKGKRKGNAKAPSANALEPASMPLSVRASPLNIFSDAYNKYQEDLAGIDGAIEAEWKRFSEAQPGSATLSSAAIVEAGEWTVAHLNDKLERLRAVIELLGKVPGSDLDTLRSIHPSLTEQVNNTNGRIKEVTRHAENLSQSKLREECLTSLELNKVVNLIELKQIRPLTKSPQLHRQMQRVKRDLEGAPVLGSDGKFVMEDYPLHMRGWVMGYPLQVDDEPDKPEAPKKRKIVIHVHYDPQTHQIGPCSLKRWDERNWSINPDTRQPVTRQALSGKQRDLIVRLLDKQIGAPSGAPFNWSSLFPPTLTQEMIVQLQAGRENHR